MQVWLVSEKTKVWIGCLIKKIIPYPLNGRQALKGNKKKKTESDSDTSEPSSQFA